MKKFKAILALLLVTALVLALFAACAKTENTNTTPSTSTEDKPAETKPEETKPAETKPEETKPEEPEPEDNQPEEPESKFFEEGEIVDIKMIMFDLRMTALDHGERIAKAVSAYTEETYGLHVDIDFYTIGDWMSKVMVALAGGERVDFMPYLFATSVANMYAQNMAMPLDDLVNEYAPEALELMKDYVDAYRIGGTLYGFPVLKNWVGNGYIVMRKDILEEIGMLEKAQNIDSFATYEEILAAVHDKYTAETGMYAVAKEAARTVGPSYLWNGDKFSDIVMYESVGDGTGMAMVLDDGEDKVRFLLDDPRLEEKMVRIKGWRDNGWVWPDCALTDTHGDELMKQGVSFSEFTGSEIGVEVTKGANIGKEVICPKYYNGPITTSGVQTWGCGIPVTAEEPEAGAFFMNCLFTDPILMNLMVWGVEGEDYDIVDDQVKTRDGMYYEADFFIGNNLLLKPIYGNGVDHYEKVAQDIADAPLSHYMGFALDRRDLEDLIAGITAINDQYSPDLYTGNYTPETFAAYKTALENAQVYDYLDAIQSQLDAWKAAQ